MRKLTVVVLAAAFALGACKKEEKGASDKDKKEEPAAKKDDPAAKKDEPANPTPTPTPTPEPVAEAPIAAAAPVVADDSITLGFTPPAVGEKWTEEQTQTMALDIDAGGQKMKMTGNKVEKKTIEVLEVKEDTVTKAKYTFDIITEEQEMAGKKDSKPSAIAGKTYTLTAGTPTDVATDSGPAPAAEAEAVRDSEKKFGKSDRMAKMMAGKTFKKGEATELDSKMVMEAMDDDGSMKNASMTLTFTGMDGDNAAFDVKMVMGGSEKGNDINVEMNGKITIDPKTGQPIKMDLTGPFKMSGQFKADGSMTITATRTK
jgi:hypothetical protein